MTSRAEGSGSGDDWLYAWLGIERPREGEETAIDGRPFVLRHGILRQVGAHSDTQGQTADSFGFKWQRRDSFDSDASLARMKGWLLERYGDVAAAPWWSEYDEAPVLLDAGCGAGMSILELFAGSLARVRYLGVDVSNAVEVAAERFRERGVPGAFLQCDLGALPLAPGSVDVIFSEGVLHHTDSTEQAVHSMARLLRPGGRLLFYVYRKKGPIREFTDDWIRERLQALLPDEAWQALMPLTRLGQALGELGVELDVPEDVDLLGIPKGKIDVQRLFYWHVFKCFYHPELDLEEMNHINYDWYAPANAHRQSPEEVREWCAKAGLEIERERVEEAGITIAAKRTG